MNPTQQYSTVCPTPQKQAYNGCMGRLENLYTEAIAALLTIPDINGVTTPMTTISIGKNLPNLCFLSVRKAIDAAITCTRKDENKAHRKT